MEKEMLVHLKIKEGKLETFMGWMQSDEGMGVRKSVAYPEKSNICRMCRECSVV
jgi:hypothetical protein